MVLLDTCTLLWLVSDPKNLSEKARESITENRSGLFVSSISAFEIALKEKKGKLKLPLPVDKWFVEALEFHGIQELPVTSQISIQSIRLPDLHADPCDRLILATAITHHFSTITPDKLIHQYSSKADTHCIW